MSIQLAIDKSGKIVFSTPSQGTVLDEKLENLEAWLAKQEGFKKQVISTTEPIKKETHMAYEQRDNSGQLFRNDKKVQGDNQPNAKGKAMIGGVMYWVSAWTKTIQQGEHAGDKWQSLAFQPCENQPGPPADEAAQAAPEEDLPF